MIAWCNENSGFLMVIITAIYVIATIVICVFNGKSAKASRDQINTAQEQQNQNVGLQLYSMRSDIIHKTSKRKYNDVFWDIPLLFNEKLYNEFQMVAFDQGTLETIEAKIQAFEIQLSSLLPQNTADSYTIMIHAARRTKDYKEITILLEECISHLTDSEKEKLSIKKYVKDIKQADELDGKIGTKNFLLIQNMRKFVQESIQ